MFTESERQKGARTHLCGGLRAFHCVGPGPTQHVQMLKSPAEPTSGTLCVQLP